MEKEVLTKNIIKYSDAFASLYHGDTFEVMKTLKDKSIDMILADLPYGTTACAWDEILPFNELWREYKRLLKDDGCVILTTSQPFTWKACASNPEWFRYEIIWEKPNGTNPLLIKKQPFKVHENILVFSKNTPKYNPQITYDNKPYSGFIDKTKTLGEVFSGSEKSKKNLISKHKENKEGSRYPRSIQKFKQDRSGHPTKKPVDLFRWLIRTFSNEDDIILDNTVGEGTTIIASILERRIPIGIEKEEKYIIKTIKDYKELSNVYIDTKNETALEKRFKELSCTF